MTGQRRRLRAAGLALLGAVAVGGCAAEPVVETHEVEVVPEVCLTALDLAEQNLDALADLVDFYADGNDDWTTAFDGATDAGEALRERREMTGSIDERLDLEAYVMAANVCRNRA